VKNAFELVLHADKSGALQVKRFTMGAQALFPTCCKKRNCGCSKRRLTRKRSCLAGRMRFGRDG